MTIAVADDEGTDMTVKAQRDELLRLYSTRRLSPVKAAERVGVPVEFARRVRREFGELIDPPELDAAYLARRRRLAVALLPHLLAYDSRSLAMLFGLPESDVDTIVGQSLESDLDLLLRRLPVGVAFVSWAAGLHRPAA